jgi:hypothetical protein
MLRDSDGTVTIVHETHHNGLFSQEMCLRILADTGFVPEVRTEETADDWTSRTVFVGHRRA